MKGVGPLDNAVLTVAVADVVMSFDNVLAIAPIAYDNLILIILGLAISVHGGSGDSRALVTVGFPFAGGRPRHFSGHRAGLCWRKVRA